MKVLLLGFVFCTLQVSFAEDGPGSSKLRNFQARPLHKPETQNSPMIIPVPVYTPVQQYPIQQFPPIQQIPVQQYPVHQYLPVQQIPLHHPQYHQVQHYPQMYHPFSHQSPPQYYHGIPC